MSSFATPLDQVAAYGEAFRWTLRDLAAADNRVAAAANKLDDKRGYFTGKAFARAFDDSKPSVRDLLYQKMNGRTREEAEEEEALRPFREALAREEAERDDVRQVLVGLADRLIEGAIQLGVQDTTSLTVFRQTWSQQDLLRALGLVDNISARAFLAMKHGDLLAAVTRSLQCLADLQCVEADWWRLEVAPPPPPFEPEFDSFGRPTRKHDERYKAFQGERAARKAELARRRDELRAEMRKLGDPLMALAVRPEINLQPSRLRNLLQDWSPHVPSNPDRVHEARNFLADLSLKLRDATIAASLARDVPAPGAADLARPSTTSGKAAGTAAVLAPPLPGWVAVTDAASHYGFTKKQAEALRKKLERYRKRNPMDTVNVKETTNPAMHEPKFLYSGDLVHQYARDFPTR